MRPAVWALALAAGLASCSNEDDDRRDQHYGTDVGMNYQLPDGFLDRTPDIGSDARDAAVLDAASGEDAPPGGSADAAAFQDTGEAADTETGG
jgi:hypothetical protein